MEHKGVLKKPSEVLKDQVVSLAGSITRQNGEEAKEFEWSSKSVNNLVWALMGRHLGSMQQPDPRHVDQFLEMAKEEMERRAGLFMEIYNHEQFLLDYPNRQ